MDIIKNPEGFYQIKQTGDIILKMPFASRNKTYIALCTDVIENKVVHFEWEGRFGFFTSDSAYFLVNSGKAAYIEDKELKEVEEYIQGNL